MADKEKRDIGEALGMIETRGLIGMIEAPDAGPPGGGFSRSGDPSPFPPGLYLPAELLQQSLIAHHEQRLRRAAEQIEQLSLRGARVDFTAVGQPRQGAPPACRFEQPDSE